MQKTILVVDDEPSVRFMCKQMLGEAGYRVVLAEEGQSALLSALTEQPDLVITDMDMPIFDGNKTISMLQRDETLQVPIIVVSGFLTISDGQRLVETTPARAFFPKPVGRDQLLDKIRELIGE
jgi:CheY-like chemotaxis protein